MTKQTNNRQLMGTICLSVASMCALGCDNTADALQEEAAEEEREAEMAADELERDVEEAVNDTERAVEHAGDEVEHAVDEADRELAQEIREEE